MKLTNIRGGEERLRIWPALGSGYKSPGGLGLDGLPELSGILSSAEAIRGGYVF